MHRRVGDQDRSAPAQRERRADDPVARLCVDAAADVFERRRIAAGEAGDHRVRIAKRDHAGREMVAVVVNEALGVAVQVTLPLKPGVEIVDIGFVARRYAGVQEFDARPVEIEAE